MYATNLAALTLTDTTTLLTSNKCSATKAQYTERSSSSLYKLHQPALTLTRRSHSRALFKLLRFLTHTRMHTTVAQTHVLLHVCMQGYMQISRKTSCYCALALWFLLRIFVFSGHRKKSATIYPAITSHIRMRSDMRLIVCVYIVSSSAAAAACTPQLFVISGQLLCYVHYC